MPSPIALPLKSAHRDVFDAFTPIVDLLPLSRDTYPRVFDNPKRDRGYYIALAVILIIWSITPLSM